MSSFTQLVRQGIKSRRMSLRELSRRVALDPSFFSKVLSGKRSPPAEEEVLRKIATSLNLNPVELIVAAGRIPEEWKELLQNKALLHSVERIALRRRRMDSLELRP